MRRTYGVAIVFAFTACTAFATPTPQYGSLMQQAQTNYRSGRYAAAEAGFISALRVLGKEDDLERAETLAALGDAYTNEDKLVDAEETYRRSLKIYKKRGDTEQTSLLLRDIAAIYSLQTRYDDALSILKTALKLTRANGYSPLEVEVLNILGVIHYRQGRNEKAAKYFYQALDVAANAKIDPDRAELFNNLANVYQAEHKYGEAEALLLRALQYIEAARGPMHPDLTFSLSSLAILYTQTGRYADAEKQYQRALAILVPREGEFETRIARLLDGLSMTYAQAGRQSDADIALERAVALARRNVKEHPDMAKIIESYSISLKNRGRFEEAADVRAEAKRARMTKALVVRAPQETE